MKPYEITRENPVCLYTAGESPPHSHPVPEIVLITAGNGIHRIGELELPCKAGDLFIVNAEMEHSFEREGKEPLVIRHLLFSPEELHIPTEDCFGVFRDDGAVGYATLTEGSRREIEGYYETILRESTERRFQWREVVCATLTVLLIAVGRYVNDAIKNTSTLKPREQEMMCVLRRGLEEFRDPTLTLEVLSGRLFVSESYLSRLYKRVTGEPFSLSLRRRRIQYACRLLLKTDFKVEEIVGQCGLKDIPSFYKSFHEIMGLTPAQYRIQNTEKGDSIMSIFNEISENLQKGRAKLVKELVQKALDESFSPAEILENGLLAGMSVVGEKFKNNEVYIPEVLVAARAMDMGTQVLKPYLQAAGVEALGKACIGTVQGDMHDIGKNLVRMMMEGKGIEVVDLGTDVAPEAFVAAAKEQGCDIICCSALLTTTMPVMEKVVKLAEAEGIRDSVKIMVGGAPVNQDFCDAIGADCYTVDAASAADAAAAFLRG